VKTEVAIADIGLADTTFDGGGLERLVKLYRMPDAPTTHHLRNQLTIDVPETGDAPLFVRVTQIDGHKMWSSPIYLYRR
jgi:hypothetical protein